jgi:hypothetical protein
VCSARRLSVACCSPSSPSFLYGLTGHFSTRGDAIIGTMGTFLTVGADGVWQIVVKSGECRGRRGGRGQGIRVGGLAGLKAT